MASIIRIKRSSGTAKPASLNWGEMAYVTGIGQYGGANQYKDRVFLGDEWGEQGIFTLFAILFVFVGAQFMAMGLLGEYIGRIYHDVRDRPRYFIDQVVIDMMDIIDIFINA